VVATDLYKYSPDAVPPIHVISYHEPRISLPPKMATSSGLFLATIYNQSHLAERKHVARYWLINTAATAVPLSARPSLLVITTKLAAAILGGGGGCSEEVFCRPSTAPVVVAMVFSQLSVSSSMWRSPSYLLFPTCLLCGSWSAVVRFHRYKSQYLCR